MKKRFAVLLLMMAMALCASGAVAACIHTEATALTTEKINELEESLPEGIYYLSNDVYGKLKIPEGAEVTLCLNGNDLSVANLSTVIEVEQDAMLTIVDCIGGGHVYASSNCTGVKNHGTFVMESGNVSASSNQSRGVYNEGTVIMRGNASVTASSINNIVSYGVYNEGTVIMQGTASVTASSTSSGESYGVYNEGTVIMQGTASVTAKEYGRGVYNYGYSSSLTMHDTASVMVESNESYGVYNYGGSSSLTMYGETSVKCNDFGVYNYGYSSSLTMYGKARVTSNNADAVFNNGTLNMNGNAVVEGKGGVNNKGTVTMNDEARIVATGTYSNCHGVENDGSNSKLFINDEASVTAQKGCGVENYCTVTMSGGSVTSQEEYGVVNRHISSVHGKLQMSAGTISGGKQAVAEKKNELTTLPEEEAVQMYILPGSCKVDGAFGGKRVVVAKGSADAAAAAAADLPKTGDPSMLGAWICLLAASGAMGMKMRRKN